MHHFKKLICNSIIISLFLLTLISCSSTKLSPVIHSYLYNGNSIDVELSDKSVNEVKSIKIYYSIDYNNFMKDNQWSKEQAQRYVKQKYDKIMRFKNNDRIFFTTDPDSDFTLTEEQKEGNPLRLLVWSSSLQEPITDLSGYGYNVRISMYFSKNKEDMFFTEIYDFLKISKSSYNDKDVLLYQELLADESFVFHEVFSKGEFLETPVE